MKKHLIRNSELDWTEKRFPQISPDRRGLFKCFTSEHGLEQFEARLTRIPPGESNTWYHTHNVIEEWFYVVRGTCHFNLEGQWLEVGPGDSIATAPGEWHTFRNFGDEDCEIIMVGINDPADQSQRREEPAPPDLS